MLVLPLIDLLILVGTLCLLIGTGLKVADIATTYHPTILGFSSIDFVLLMGVCWGFALTLAARTWVKLNEPKLFELRREQMRARGREQAREYDYGVAIAVAGGLEEGGSPAAESGGIGRAALGGASRREG